VKCPASFFTCFWWYTELGQVWRWWRVHWTCSVCFFNLGEWGWGRGMTLGWGLLHHFKVLSTLCTLCTGSHPQNMGVSCQGLRSTECKNTHTHTLSLFLIQEHAPIANDTPRDSYIKWDVVVPGWVVFIPKHKW
jgi:hypothetical protein